MRFVINLFCQKMIFICSRVLSSTPPMALVHYLLLLLSSISENQKTLASTTSTQSTSLCIYLILISFPIFCENSNLQFIFQTAYSTTSTSTTLTTATTTDTTSIQTSQDSNIDSTTTSLATQTMVTSALSQQLPSWLLRAFVAIACCNIFFSLWLVD